jgi:N-terminal domain of anti-restriction factor ArdC
VRRRLHIVREKTFSLNNVCLIVAQRPAATRVAGYHTWRSLGRFVRKGEKGIAILAPILRRRRDETDEEESRVIAGFRTAYFDERLAEIAQGGFAGPAEALFGHWLDPGPDWDQ